MSFSNSLQDIDECDDFFTCGVDKDQVCTNTVGSFVCATPEAPTKPPPTQAPTLVCKDDQNFCLKCTQTHMYGAIKYDKLYLESLVALEEAERIEELKTVARFNDVRNSDCTTDTKLRFDNETRLMKFDLELGECNMKAEAKAVNGTE